MVNNVVEIITDIDTDSKGIGMVFKVGVLN